MRAMLNLQPFKFTPKPNPITGAGSAMVALRCDHCRKPLAGRTHRYWRMCFCSQACVAGYQKRLGADTRTKIHCLEMAAH
jgi:hypothetical protein